MNRPEIIGIVAMDPNGVIGCNNNIPWSIPTDMEHFKTTTLLHTVVMGRRTFESIGRPLSKRKNIVLTSNTEWTHKNVETIHVPEELLLRNPTTPVYIIGGTEVYKSYMHMMYHLLISHIKKEYTGDTFFPPYKHLFPNEETIMETEEFTVVKHSR